MLKIRLERMGKNRGKAREKARKSMASICLGSCYKEVKQLAVCN